MEIITYPNPILRQRAEPVRTVVLEQVAEMARLLREHNGYGLSAPQVGLSLRMFVCNRNVILSKAGQRLSRADSRPASEATSARLLPTRISGRRSAAHRISRPTS